MSKKEYVEANVTMISCKGAVVPVPIPLLCPLSHGVISCKTHMPLMNVNDFVPMMNILPFGLCKNMPQTPAGPPPCVPAVVSPWKKGDKHYQIAGADALTKESFVTCTFGGKIEIK